MNKLILVMYVYIYIYIYIYVYIYVYVCAILFTLYTFACRYNDLYHTDITVWVCWRMLSPQCAHFHYTQRSPSIAEANSSWVAIGNATLPQRRRQILSSRNGKSSLPSQASCIHCASEMVW